MLLILFSILNIFLIDSSFCFPQQEQNFEAPTISASNNANFTCHAIGSKDIKCSNNEMYTKEEIDPPLSGAFWSDAAVSFSLVMCAGIMSGVSCCLHVFFVFCQI